MSEFSQLEEENAVCKIKGYHGVPRNPRTKYETLFKKAKAETLKHMRRQLEAVKAIDFEKFKEIGPRV